MIEIVIYVILILWPMQLDPSFDPGPSCPGAGDCCVANGTPGCLDTGCCQTVCALLPNCCNIGWSDSCAAQANVLCGGLCAASGCPGAGDCCEVHQGAGCSSTSCCATVCAENESCCRSDWDDDCVNLAEALCDPLCETAQGCPGNGSCCFNNGTPGCDDARCCSIVCTADSFCCNGKWDDICARKANEMCGVEGADYCDWCPSEGNCCEARESPGCERQACCDAVCNQLLRCCTRFWDATCAGMGATLCAETACDCPFFGDLDGIGFVDLRDAAAFMDCFTGQDGGPISGDCACADDDGDGDVDLSDYGNFAPFLIGE